MNAVSAPICMLPSSTRWPPNHSTATVLTLRISITAGNIVAIQRPVLSATAVSSSLAVWKRRVS